MAPKILTGLPGVIIVHAEGTKTDAATVDFLKQSQLYKKMEALLGSERAAEIIRNGDENQMNLPLGAENR